MSSFHNKLLTDCSRKLNSPRQYPMYTHVHIKLAIVYYIYPLPQETDFETEPEKIHHLKNIVLLFTLVEVCGHLSHPVQPVKWWSQASGLWGTQRYVHSLMGLYCCNDPA